MTSRALASVVRRIPQRLSVRELARRVQSRFVGWSALPDPLRGLVARAGISSIALVSVALVASCQRAAAPSEPSAPPFGGGLSSVQGTPGRLTGVLPATDLAVGTDQRFLLALIGPDNQLVGDASVELTFVKVTGPGVAQFRGQASADFRESLPGKPVYVARTDFDEPGDWGIVAAVSRPDGSSTELQLGFQVKAKSSTPAIGDPVPASRTLTGASLDEVERFSSARPPDLRFYRLSIADAIAQGKPFAVIFATPGFCVSRLCGPSLDSLKALADRYGGQMSYIHVEIYKDGRPNEKQEMVPTVSEWGLTSEPWLFIVGTDGRLVDKFEGTITVEEAVPAVERALGQD